MGRLRVVFLFGFAAFALLAPGSAYAQILEVTMSGGQVVPPTQSPGVGSGNGWTDCWGYGGTVWIDLRCEGMLSPPIAFEIHGGAHGQNGPLYETLSDLEGGGGSYWCNAELPFTGELCDALWSEMLYVVVTTTAFPEGEIRGQILVRLDPVAPASWGKLKLLYR